MSPQADAVLAVLRRILNSADFDAPERNRRFLRYIVEETLAGRSNQIKAYAIATSVFERAPDFDPQLDSIVRIEAGRLRRSLDNYYLREGADDPIRIMIPKGSYVPAFEPASARAPIGNASPSGASTARALHDRRGPTIFVAPFDEEGDQSGFPNFTRGLVRQIIVGLTRFTELVVFGQSTTFGSGSQSDRERIFSELGADFILTGGTSLSAAHFSVEVLLIDARTGRCLWGESFKRTLHPGEIFSLRDEVAERVVRVLAQPYGILFSKARETDGPNPGSLGSYDEVVRFHLYWRTYDADQFEAVRAGLEEVVAMDPTYAEAYACLSQMYSNAARFGYDVGGAVADPLQRAMDLARRAISLAPGSSRGHHALGLACWFSGDVNGSLEALKTGLRLNPNDTEIMADLGLRHAMLTQWDEAVPLLEESYARNPAQPGTYRIGLALFHYFHGRYAAALAEARKIDAPNVIYGHLIEAAAARALGAEKVAEAAVQVILAIDPGYFDHIAQDLQSRSLHPDLICAIMEGLQVSVRPNSDAGSERRGLTEYPGGNKAGHGV